MKFVLVADIVCHSVEQVSSTRCTQSARRGQRVSRSVVGLIALMVIRNAPFTIISIHIGGRLIMVHIPMTGMRRGLNIILRVPNTMINHTTVKHSLSYLQKAWYSSVCLTIIAIIRVTARIRMLIVVVIRNMVMFNDRRLIMFRPMCTNIMTATGVIIIPRLSVPYLAFGVLRI